jgi:hypothetical protein
MNSKLFAITLIFLALISITIIIKNSLDSFPPSILLWKISQNEIFFFFFLNKMRLNTLLIKKSKFMGYWDSSSNLIIQSLKFCIILDLHIWW